MIIKNTRIYNLLKEQFIQKWTFRHNLESFSHQSLKVIWAWVNDARIEIFCQTIPLRYCVSNA